MRDRTGSEGRKDVWDYFGEGVQAAARAVVTLVREGNRRQLALRKQGGDPLVRLPLTVAVLVGLVLLWWSWPLLVLALVLILALRGSVVILRREPRGG